MDGRIGRRGEITLGVTVVVVKSGFGRDIASLYAVSYKKLADERLGIQMTTTTTMITTTTVIVN